TFRVPRRLTIDNDSRVLTTSKKAWLFDGVTLTLPATTPTPVPVWILALPSTTSTEECSYSTEELCPIFIDDPLRTIGAAEPAPVSSLSPANMLVEPLTGAPLSITLPLTESIALSVWPVAMPTAATQHTTTSLALNDIV